MSCKYDEMKWVDINEKSTKKDQYFNVLNLSWEVYEFGKTVNAVNFRINEVIGGVNEGSYCWSLINDYEDIEQLLLMMIKVRGIRALNFTDFNFFKFFLGWEILNFDGLKNHQPNATLHPFHFCIKKFKCGFC